MTNAVASLLLPALVMVVNTNRTAVNLVWSAPPGSLTQIQESDDGTNWRWVCETTNDSVAVVLYGTNTAGVHQFQARTVLYSPFSNIASVTNSH